MSSALPGKRRLRRVIELPGAASGRHHPSATTTNTAERQAPTAMPPEGSQGRVLRERGNTQAGNVPVSHQPASTNNGRVNHTNDTVYGTESENDDLHGQGSDNEFSDDEDEENAGNQVNVEQYQDAIPDLEGGDEDNTEEDPAEVQRETKRARLMDFDLRHQDAKAYYAGAPGMDTRQLFLKLLEAMHVNNLMMRDMLLMQENVEYHLTKDDRQKPAAGDASINEKSANSVLDATMTEPLLEHIWAAGFFAIEGFGPALAKAAGYKDVQELQSKASGLYMRMLTRVKPVLRALRKKLNKAAKGSLSHSAAFGELMIVTHPGAKPSLHVRNLLQGDAWAREQQGDGRRGKIMSSPGFKFATAQMFDLQDDNGNPPQKLALRAPQLAFMLMWGRKLLRNHAEMPNQSVPKQYWQTEYDIVSAEIASTRNNPNIDYTGWPALAPNNPA